MIQRNLVNPMFELGLGRQKMVFLSGPRQVGKTTLSHQFKSYFTDLEYRNWDQDRVARLWNKDPELLLGSYLGIKDNKKKLFIFDEIHKSKNWKRKLKGLFDVHGSDLNFLITGSARLNTYKRGGDSLLGRYLNFRLHPLSVGELLGNKIIDPPLVLSAILQDSRASSGLELKKLLEFGGFPEPFLEANPRLSTLWKKDRRDRIIKEDLRDLFRSQEISQLRNLALILPEKVGSPLSYQTLVEDLQVSHDSIRRWLNWFQELYIHFEVKPWSKNIKRSLKKEGKIYLYDWSEISELGPRFENLIASHLKKSCDYWTDLGFGSFDLYYLRNKDKQEIDFLVVKDSKPFFAVESKLSEKNVNFESLKKFQSQIQCPVLLTTLENTPLKRTIQGQIYIVNATQLFKHLP